MKPSRTLPPAQPGRVASRLFALLALVALAPAPAHASMFHGETLDAIADVMAWVVLIVAPTVGLAVFWLVHILPEKIAEKRQHPQAGAIQCLCLLSLVFGGLLWPIAWLWAFSKPVLYKMAYGTDKVEHGHGDKAKHAEPEKPKAAEAEKPKPADDAEQLKRLRAEVAALEARLAPKANTQGGKA
ncbi:MAG: DUF3302 domain-containing protein [Opitutaceae bacterium]|nr:DUF3302 domain-containing protein [Opitutaceae bacterium]